MFDSKLTVFIHTRSEAFVKTTSAALIAVGLIHRTAVLHLTLSFAGVYSVPMNTPFKESRTSWKIMHHQASRYFRFRSLQWDLESFDSISSFEWTYWELFDLIFNVIVIIWRLLVGHSLLWRMIDISFDHVHILKRFLMIDGNQFKHFSRHLHF